MIPVQRFALKEHYGEYREHNQRYNLLNNLQLHQGENSSVTREAKPVCWNLARIFGQSQEPTEQYHHVERCVARQHLHLL